MISTMESRLAANLEREREIENVKNEETEANKVGRLC